MATNIATPENAAATCESVQDIIDIAVTAEALAVTALGAALESAAKGTLKLNAEHIQAFTAARAEEQAHYDVLTSAGAKPLTTTFTVPDPKIFTDAATFLPAVIGLEEAFVAAYLAAAQEFAILGKPELSQLALAIASVEAEHRVAVRSFAVEAGMLKGLPNDIAFEQALFASVGAAADALKQLGWIGGSGAQITYPGPGKIDPTGVNQLKP
ncbi:MAG: ferritin-like domain-containing protein [Thermomicrobiales bacterium]